MERALNLPLSAKSKRRMEDFREKHIQHMGHIFDALTDTEFMSYCQLLDKITRVQADKE